MKSNKGSILVALWVGTVVVGLAAFSLSKTKWFHGDTKRANEAKETTVELVAAKNAQASAAVSYLEIIGETNQEAPDSKQKVVISQLVNPAIGYLGVAGDLKKRVEALAIKNAVLEGKLALATSLTNDALGRANDAIERATKAEDAKKSADDELARVAAERVGAEKARFVYFAAIGFLVVIYLYTKLTHIGPGAVAELVSDLKNSTGPVAVADKFGDLHIPAVDAVTSRLQQKITRFWSKFV